MNDGPIQWRVRGDARRRRPLLAGVLLASSLVLGAQAASAASGVFWTSTNSGAIGRASLDGTGASQSLVTGATFPRGVAVAGDYVYWANNSGNAIGRAKLDGTSVNQTFITGANGPSGVAADESHLYWANTGNGRIGRASLDGTGVNQSFISGGNSVTGVAVDESHVYWNNYGSDRMGRANLDGSGVNQSFITGLSGPHGVTVDAGHLYWTNANTSTIGRANLDGTGVNQSFIALSGLAFYMADDGAHIYWANYAGNAVGRANLDGTDVDQTFITGANGTFGVAALVADPVAALSPGAGAFADQQVGATSPPQGFTVRNTGTGALTVGAVALGGADASQFAMGADTCSGQKVAVGAACSIAIRFAPTSGGPKAAALTIPSDDAASPATAALSGTGIEAPAPASDAIPPFSGPAAPSSDSSTAPAAPTLTPIAGQSRTALATADLSVVVGAPGTLASTVSATIGGRSVRIPAPTVSVPAAGAVHVPLALPASVRSLLAERGRVRVAVTSVFTPTGGRSVASTAVVTLHAPPSRLLGGQWLARPLGPWAQLPRLSPRIRSAVSLAERDGRNVARVIR